MSESPFRSPFAALVWKEWRESWWLLVLVVLGPTVFAYVALKATAWVEMETITLPVGVRVWAARALSGRRAFRRRARARDVGFSGRKAGESRHDLECKTPHADPGAGRRRYSVPSHGRLALSARHLALLMTIVSFMFVVMEFLDFASAVFCSVLLPRPVTAWAAGGVLCFATALGACGLAAPLMDRLSRTDMYRPWLLFLFLLTIEAIGLLWLSRVAYVRWMHD